MAITRTAWIDDDGSGTTGTVINNAEKTRLYDQIDAALVTTGNAAAIVGVNPTGTQHDYVLPGRTRDCLWQWDGAASLTLTGIAGGQVGDRLTISNQSGTGATVSLAHYTTSVTANRLFNAATSAATPIALGGAATYVHNGTVWVLIAHEQGAWVTPPYSAGNFVSATGTWTVDAGDVTTYAYRLSGRTITVSWYLQATTVSGASNVLKITIPGGFYAALSGLFPMVQDDAGVGNAGTFCLTGAGGPAIDCYKSYGAGSWAAATNSTRVFGTITFAVT